MATEGQKRRRRKRGKLKGSKYRRFIKTRLWQSAIDRYGLVCCALCGMPIAFDEATLDHKIPISRGGSNRIANLQLAHLLCNQYKGDSV